MRLWCDICKRETEHRRVIHLKGTITMRDPEHEGDDGIDREVEQDEDWECEECEEPLND